ncbi:MAG: ATP-binding protein [Dysgonamonadaceae bacterium]|jgi:hypothetical protein|nr:ATP-binding protein [Dysgonamonadaceae bacterium]
MQPENRRFPIGQQDFKYLRVNQFLYVDKTQFIYNLANGGKQFFLSRPRRFGKSLLLSTIRYYFEGKKELFKELAVERLETEWAEYPVFLIDMNMTAYTDLQSLHTGLDMNLRRLEETWGKNPDEKAPSARLEGLIRRAYEKTGKGVVILFDEYDKPLLGTMDSLDANDAIRTELKGFYGLMKTMDEYLRFVLYSGVTKFSKISIFSDLNQPDDISGLDAYSEICGITEKELLENFEIEIHKLAANNEETYETALSELKRRYDGYHFTKNSAGLYNPFSLLNVLKNSEYGNYWYKTGTPTFLVKMIADGELDIRNFENNIPVEVNKLDEYKVGLNSPVPILYQSGYLTIKGYDKTFNSYILGFPNEEVKYGFLDDLLPTFLPIPHLNQLDFTAMRFAKAIRENRIDDFMEMLRARFASIPYDLKDRTERSYQMGFWLIFELMGQYCQTEVKSVKGRADAVVKTQDTVYVFEFKMQKNGTAEDALAQIDDKGYLIPYTADGRKLVKIGVEFSEEEKTLSRWLVKEN